MKPHRQPNLFAPSRKLRAARGKPAGDRLLTQRELRASLALYSPTGRADVPVGEKTDIEAQERDEGSARYPTAENAQTAPSDARSSTETHSERTIDAERAGGTGNVVPKAAVAAPEMTYTEAIEYDAKFRWRSLSTKSDRARQALIAEVKRLISQNAILVGGSLAREGHIAALSDELARLRAALPEVIGCALGGDGVRCIEIGFKCCDVRQRMIRAGLLPQTGAQNADE